MLVAVNIASILISIVLALPHDEGCIKIKKCPAAIDHVKNIKNDKASLEILEKAHCGFEGHEPIVKCNSIPRLSSTSNVECIPLQDCPAALRLIDSKVFDPALVNLLRKSHCGEVKSHPLIKCQNIINALI